jgi:excinuclease ABC subunit A
LSGGEAQRLKLAPFFSKQHGAEHFLIMDEPTTGLHTQDAALLVEVLGKLRDLGTTIIMIEHSSDMIQAADWLIDLGPGSADGGGRVLYSGPPGGILGVEESITARYLH